VTTITERTVRKREYGNRCFDCGDGPLPGQRIYCDDCKRERKLARDRENAAIRYAGQRRTTCVRCELTLLVRGDGYCNFCKVELGLVREDELEMASDAAAIMENG
jgi:hypothetical protein